MTRERRVDAREVYLKARSLAAAERDELLRRECADDSDMREEVEVMRAVAASGRGPLIRGADLSPFLRRPGNRDCRRLLKKLETWFLRQYDVRHAAAVLQHHDHLVAG